MEGTAGYLVLIGHGSVTISYSFRCLTTETVKFINIKMKLHQNTCMWAQRERQTNIIINVHFACPEEVSCPVLHTCKQVCVSKLLSAKKEK